MNVNFKMQDATPRGSHNLCHSCVYGQSIRGQNFEERVICNRNSYKPMELGFNVERCTGYYQRGLVTVQEMEKVAWIISTETVGPIGFATGTESQELEVRIKKPEAPTTTIITTTETRK